MNVSLRILLLAAISSMILLSGCATNRSVLSLSLPAPEIEAQQTGSKVFIKAVSDQRVFQENPRTQDIPSLGFGGAANTAQELKKRAVGRKRNSFGKALGDILLQENQNVETVIRSALQQAFKEKGFTVITDEGRVDSDTIIAEAKIEKFWAYMTPGFWAIALTSDIATELSLTSPGTNKVKTISVKAEDNYQVATDGNWQEIIDQALVQYINKAKDVLSQESSLGQ